MKSSAGLTEQTAICPALTGSTQAGGTLEATFRGQAPCNQLSGQPRLDLGPICKRNAVAFNDNRLLMYRGHH